MAGGGARRGTLVIHYGTGYRRPAPRPRQPQDGTGSCGSQPANQSLLDRRLQRCPLPCAILSLVSAAEPIGRRTIMSYALGKGHESGLTKTFGTYKRYRPTSGTVRHRPDSLLLRFDDAPRRVVRQPEGRGQTHEPTIP